MYEAIHYVWGAVSYELCLYARTSTVQILHHQSSLHCFNPFGCDLHPVQYMYGRIANFKEVSTYVLWDSWELWLYACTSTVQIWIDFTKVAWNISFHFMTIPMLYS